MFFGPAGKQRRARLAPSREPTDVASGIEVGRYLWVQRGPGAGALTLTADAGVLLQGPEGVVQTAGGIASVAFPDLGAVLLHKAGPDAWRILQAAGFAPIGAVKVGVGAPVGANASGSYVRMDVPWRGVRYANGVRVDESMLWAARPAASADLEGATINIHDPAFGLIREDFICLDVGGWRWVPMRGQIEYMVAPSSSVTLTTGVTVLGAVALPADLVYPGVEATMRCKPSYAGTSATKTLIQRIQGATHWATGSQSPAATTLSAEHTKSITFTSNTTAVSLTGGVNGFTSGQAVDVNESSNLNLAGSGVTFEWAVQGGAATTDTARLVMAGVTLEFPRKRWAPVSAPPPPPPPPPPPAPSYPAASLVVTETSPGTVAMTWPTSWAVSTIGRNGQDSKGVAAWSGLPAQLPFRDLLPATLYTLFARMADGAEVTKQITTAPAAASPPPAAPPVAHPPAPSTRKADEEPFSETSIWNTPLGDGAIYVAFPNRFPPGNLPQDYTDLGIDQEPLFIKKTTQGAVSRVMRRIGPWGDNNMRYPTGSDPVHPRSPILIPNGVRLASPNNRNCCSAWITSDAGMVEHDQKITRNDDAMVGGQESIARSGAQAVPAYHIATGDGRLGSHGGTNLSALGGSIRCGEFRPGAPGSGGVPGLPGKPGFHPLKLTGDFRVMLTPAANYSEWHPTNNPGGAWRWPAVKSDGSGGQYGVHAPAGMPSGLVAGALLALDWSVDIFALGLETNLGLLIAWTLKHYGIYLVDESGHSHSAISTGRTNGVGEGSYLLCAQVRGSNSADVSDPTVN